MNIIQKIFSLVFTVSLVLSGFAQKSVQQGEIKNEDFVFEKDRKIVLPIANRIFDKIPSTKSANTTNQVEYKFVERKLSIPNSKFTPILSTYQNDVSKKEQMFENYVRVGAGNYARYFGEAFLIKADESGNLIGANLKHNSTTLGPVDTKNSGTSEQDLKLFGKYQTNSFKVDGQIFLDRKQFYFYGYKPRASVNVDRDTIKQILNKYGASVGIDNTNKNFSIDYHLKTKVTYLKDNYQASELDWSSTLYGSFRITDNFNSLLNAEANLAQRVDGTEENKNNRNLFKVKPTFVYSNDVINVTFGINAVLETDKTSGLNRTKGFPVFNVDVALAQPLHVFVGVDGDIERNTLTSLLTGNQFLKNNIKLLNTEKTIEIYAGAKGIISSEFQYEAKFSFSKFKNFRVYNNAGKDTSKFEVLYDSLNTVTQSTFSGKINYQGSELWRSSFGIELHSFGLSNSYFEKAWHRPNFELNWSNTFVFKKKLLLSTDLFCLSGIYGKNFVTSQFSKLPTIIDFNTKVTYQLAENISAFVSLNNIFGKNYQRFTNYNQQGLNFLVGVSFSF